MAPRTANNKHSLKNVTILLADSDTCMARVVTQNLRALGFDSIHHVRNGAQALQALRTRPINMLITEWGMAPMDGPELIQQLRKQADSLHRTLPIIMLTGKGEVADVQLARDFGITEFVVKPFTAKTLYHHIEQVIDHPRAFVISECYIGPERRRSSKAALPEGMADRRRLTPKPIDPRQAAAIDGVSMPTIILPDYALKHKIGLHNAPLSSLITPGILEEAQRAIDALHDESMQWIKEDLHALEEACGWLLRGPTVKGAEQAKSASLSIKSRAGTFGHALASEVARLAYLFLCAHFDARKTTHANALKKHAEALKVVIAQNIRGVSGMGQELIVELQRLAAIQR